MNKNLSEEINKDIKRKFPRLSVYSAGIDDIWSMDIIDMTKWKDYNDNYIYALNIIDVFSKFAWSIPRADLENHYRARDMLRLFILFVG